MAKLDLHRIKTMNLSLNSSVKNELYTSNAFNIGSFNYYSSSNTLTPINDNSNEYFYENPFTLDAEVLRNINHYRFIYKTPVKHVYDIGTTGDTVQAIPLKVAVTSSIFNPLFNVQVLGIANNVPLLNDVSKKGMFDYYDTSDCSIKKLVQLSNAYNSELGQARYRYTDFMYCRDLGKVSNNHLITLRKFPYPVGDNIFELTSPMYRTNNSLGDYDIPGDVGRLITWFGTEENKLDDILKYNYRSTWKELNAKIQELDSKEDNQERGIVGKVLNTFNPAYNEMAAGGFAGTNHLFNYIGGRLGVPLTLHAGDNQEVLRNYDNNKVYEPKNTVQNTHIYEGKLQFEHEFTLTFNYKIRAYENINPKSAMLDLLGNIYEVTYKRGKFWGGEQKIVGPPPNVQGWKKANAFIDESWDKLGGFLKSLVNGTANLGDILSQISSAASGLVNQATQAGEKIVNGKGNEVLQNLAEQLGNFNDKYKISQALKGSLKNALGRPALYAFDSLLPDGLSGLWHVTIGNPRNPIMSIGNLILTNASVQHYGPLGIDDFPTELKVTVTLKHAKGRDLTSISKMYTRGISSIYLSNARNALADFYPQPTTSGSGNINAVEREQAEVRKRNSNPDTMNNTINNVNIENINDFAQNSAQNVRYNSNYEFNLGEHLMNPNNSFRVMTNQDRVLTARAVIDEIA